MSRLQELIAELCPDGVEYKAIKDVYRRLKGTPITAAKMKKIASDDGDITVFAGGKTKIRAHEKDIPNANITRVPALLVQSRGVIDFVYCDTPFTFKNEMWAYTADDAVSIRYLMYCLKNNAETFRAAASGMGSLPQISLKVTENYRIPVPPIEVQREVVRILDEYTAAHDELVRQLKEERETLGTQLNLLQEQLFASGAYECKQLGDVAHTFVGLATSVTKWKRPSGIRLLHNSDIQPNRIVIKNDEFIAPEFAERNKVKRLLVGDVITVHTGAVGTSSVINEEYDGALGFTTLTARILDKDELSPSYLCHVLNSDYCLAQIAKMSISDRNNLNQKSYNRILIPMPPIEEQMRIVLLLDDGLECFRELSALVDEELSLCDQQLSLVRNQLLSFPEKVA